MVIIETIDILCIFVTSCWTCDSTKNISSLIRGRSERIQAEKNRGIVEEVKLRKRMQVEGRMAALEDSRK